jgi:hypothetical protein
LPANRAQERPGRIVLTYFTADFRDEDAPTTVDGEGANLPKRVLLGTGPHAERADLFKVGGISVQRRSIVNEGRISDGGQLNPSSTRRFVLT